ncbi:3-oxoacyl-(acyl carrier protein) synthase [Geobacter sp. OR-1]|uniref:beta-ketoacyl synthase N-terminal-like domain-containing protein n=1 Tax=Geobacter sp. OR-1 TaxID=1266765 RepID=UPI000542536D|nr:beta-ketoacyl synthase N-terminal-like domain-containing protein [Geobacter sp. OR-1]GAM09402.1 3-oxoacyl-(acyl carrier protein) synthase [Geobacter sp. OR-1]
MADIVRWSGRLAITGWGAVTPVGLSAPATTAAMRAGISRIAELPGLFMKDRNGEPLPITGGEVPLIPAGRLGVARLLRLAKTAFLETVADAGIDNTKQCNVYLGMPAQNPADRVLQYGSSMTDGFQRECLAGMNGLQLRLYEKGRAAFLCALRDAADDIASGREEIAIVGGVDSWICPRSVHFLEEAGRLRDKGKSSGILPGEAAGFIVLEREDAALDRGGCIRAVLLGASGAHEGIPLGKPNTGQVLSKVFKGVLGHLRNDKTELAISDLNGERYRAYEWMYAVSRAKFHLEGGHRHWHPAEYIGDSGAASGAMAVAWAATALYKGYSGTDRVLVWGASDEGAREAAVISAA